MRKKENNRHWRRGEGRFILLGLFTVVFGVQKNRLSEPFKSGLEAIIFPMDWNVSFACDADSLGFCIQLW